MNEKLIRPLIREISAALAERGECSLSGRKVAQALVEGRGLSIKGGDVMICTSLRPECAGELHCCHRQGKED